MPFISGLFSSFSLSSMPRALLGFVQTLWGNGRGLGQSLIGAFGLWGIACFRERGFVLEEKENSSGKAFCSEQNRPICESLAPNPSPPCALLSWPPLLHKCLEKVSFLLGKERLPLFCGAEKLMRASLREALLSTSGMKGSLLFEQASSKSQL